MLQEPKKKFYRNLLHYKFKYVVKCQVLTDTYSIFSANNVGLLISYTLKVWCNLFKTKGKLELGSWQLTEHVSTYKEKWGRQVRFLRKL